MLATEMKFDVEHIRADFPILATKSHGRPLVYLDNGATTQKPRAVIDRMGVPPERFCMVGNSVRSDVLPVLAVGGHAVHIPYAITWAHEHVEDHDAAFPVLGSLDDLVRWLDGAPV